jgi:hypothetical protein
MKMEKSTRHKLKDLYDQMQETPPAFIWDEVEKNIPVYAVDKNEKRGFILWPFLLLLLLVGSGFFIYNASNPSLPLQDGNSEGPTNTKPRKLGKDEKPFAITQENNMPIASSEQTTRNDKQSHEPAKQLETKQNEIIALASNKNSPKENTSAVINESLFGLASNEAAANKHVETSPHASVIEDKALSVSKAPNVMLAFLESPKVFLKIEPQITLSQVKFGHEDKKIHWKESAKISSYFIEIDGGIFRDNRKFYQDQNAKSRAQENLENTTKAWYGVKTSIGAGIKLNSGIFMKLGLDYQKSIYKFDFQNTELLSANTLDNKVASQRIIQDTNSIVTLDIPLLFGYELTKRKFSIGAAIGPFWNAILQGKGRLVSSTYEPYYINKLNTPYLPNTGLGIHGEITLGFKMSPNFQFLTKVFYKNYVSNWNFNKINYGEQHDFLGMSIGLKSTF